MASKSRSRSSLLQFHPGKGVINRFSLTVFMVASIGFLVVSKVNGPIAESVRAHVVDTTIPVFDLLSRPVDSVVGTLDSFRDLASIRQQNIALREENERLKRGYMTSMQIESENVHLRKLLNYVGDAPNRFISARILGDNSGPFLRSAIINAGAAQGVKKGQALINEKGLIGRIIEVGDRSSRVLLITDLNSRVPIVTGESRERGILTGDNTETPHLMYLPEDTKVKVGEVVMTSGDGELFPANQPVGIVYYKNKGSVGVKPFVEWSRMEYVSVVDF